MFPVYRECIEGHNYQIDPAIRYNMKIGYLRQGDSILDEFFVELFSLLIIRMIDTALKDATAMLMSSNFNAIHSNSIINELL